MTVLPKEFPEGELAYVENLSKEPLTDYWSQVQYVTNGFIARVDDSITQEQFDQMVASVDYASQEALTDIQSIPVDSVETEDLQVLGTIISMMSEVSEYDSLFSSDAISLSIDILTAINERQDAIAAISA